MEDAVPSSQLTMEGAEQLLKPRPSLTDWRKPFTTYPLLDALGTTVAPGNLKLHSMRTDNHEFARGEVTAFVNTLAADCPYGERSGRLPDVGASGKLPPLDYLEKVLAYRCPCCERHYVELDSMKRHCRRAHKGATDLRFELVPCQNLIKGKYGLMFEITEEAEGKATVAVTSAAYIGRQIQLEIARLLQEKFRADWDSKDAWPYLKDVQWHLVVEDNYDVFTVDDLKTMVTIPPIHTNAAQGTLATNLAILTEHVIDALEKDVRRAGYDMKLMLGAETDRIEPGKVFQWLNPATVKRYGRTLAAFVLFLCHLEEQKDQYSVDFARLHKLPSIIPRLVQAVQVDNRGAAASSLLKELLIDILEYRGTLTRSMEQQYVVFHFLALRHLRADGGFPPPIDVTQALAHLQWTFRLMFFDKVQDRLRKLHAAGIETEGEMEFVEKQLRPLKTGSSTQMGAIHSMKGILRFHAEKHPRPPLARWDDLTYTKLYCEGKTFGLEEFRKMNSGILERAWAMLHRLTFDEDLDKLIKWPTCVHDKESANGDMYCFLLDQRNGFAYLNSSFATDMLEKHFTKGTINGRIQSQGVSAYLARCRELLCMIAAIMHTTSGGPPRAEEAIQTRILEGREARRNLFFMRGKLAWILDYNKSKGQQAIARFMPVEASKLIATYLALVRPLEVLLSGLGGGLQQNRSQQADMYEYLFISDGARWTGEHYGTALEQAFNEFMDQEIGIREYRQIQAALSGHHLSGWKDMLTDSGGDAAIEQQGHTVATHNREYNRIADQSQNLKRDSQMRFEHASIAWQELIFPRIGNKNDKAVRVATEKVPVVEDNPAAESQAGRSILDDIEVPLRMLTALRTILRNPEATYRSREQVIAATAMVEQGDPQSDLHRRDLLVILPTGTGKTLTWIVAQHLEPREKLTIVIVPYNALLMDLGTRLRGLGQEVRVCGEESTMPSLDTMFGFLLMSVERAVQPWMLKQIHTWEHKISRIVFDEAHLSHSAKGYRKVMDALAKLFKSRPPLALLTGTCAPQMEKPMLRHLGLENVLTVRSRTDRPEIMYTVAPGEPCAEHMVPRKVRDWTKTQLEESLRGSRSQVIIYVPLKRIGEAVAKDLDIPFFESETPPERKRKLYEGFKKGKIQMLVATQSFGAGIDISCVDVVIHAGSPRTMIDFAQEAGRAGRAGQPALSIIFRSTSRVRTGGDLEFCGAQEMQDWLSESGRCRRKGLSAYLDGWAASCALLPGGNLCDICRIDGYAKASVEDDIRKQILSRRATTPALFATVVETSPLSSETTGLASGTISSSMTDEMHTHAVGLRHEPLHEDMTSEWTGSVPGSQSSRMGLTASMVDVGPVTPQKRTSIGDNAWDSGSAKRRAFFLGMSPLSRGPPNTASSSGRVAFPRPSYQSPGRSATTRGTSGRPQLAAEPSFPMTPVGGRIQRLATENTRKGPISASVQFPGPKMGETGWEKMSVCGTLQKKESYAEKLLPSLKLFIRKRGVCFVCVGIGELSRCEIGRCPVEHRIKAVEEAHDIMEAVNGLGNFMRIQLPLIGHCNMCYLPLPAGGETNAFHPDGMARERPCLVFAAMGIKALTCGSRLWIQKMMGGSQTNSETDPVWLRDLVNEGRQMSEYTVESFARLLLTKCTAQEYWVLRVLCEMIKEAVEEDEARGKPR